MRVALQRAGNGLQVVLRARGIGGGTHGACRAMQVERLTFVRHTCLRNMPPLIPFRGVLFSSVPAPLVKLYEFLPSVLLQVKTPFPDQSGQLSAANSSSSLQIPQKQGNNGLSNCSALHHYV